MKKNINHRKIVSSIMKLSIFLLVMFLNCKREKQNELKQFGKLPSNMKGILINHRGNIEHTKQILVITSKASNPIYVKIHHLGKKNGEWHEELPPIKATIGRNGFAEFNIKKEGDGKTPTGIFALGTAFGYDVTIDTKMPYKQTTENDFWIDDVNSDNYNTWVSGQPKAKSYEKMRGGTHYKYGIVVEYNTNPIIKGKGSAIFIHLWLKPGVKTAGCVAMSETDMLTLLKWLHPEKNPLVIMGKEAILKSVKINF